MKLQGTLRAFPAGTPVAGIDVDLVLEADDSTLDTDTTDSEGRYSFAVDLNPGPVRWEATDTAEDPDVIRAGSSLSYGSGGVYSLYELPEVLTALGDGVVAGYGDEFEVTYDGAGVDLDVGTGACLLDGVPQVMYNAVHLDASDLGQHATLYRNVAIVLNQSDRGQSDEGKCALTVIQGDTFANANQKANFPPSLTPPANHHYLVLAECVIPPVGIAIGDVLDGGVQDFRGFLFDTSFSRQTVLNVNRRASGTAEVSVASTTGEDVVWTSGDGSLTLQEEVDYDVTVRVFLLTKVASAAQTVSIAPWFQDTSNIADYVDNTATDYTGIGNVHTTTLRLDAGSPGHPDSQIVNVGCRIKKSSGATASYLSGYIMVTAIPRA